MQPNGLSTSHITGDPGEPNEVFIRRVNISGDWGHGCEDPTCEASSLICPKLEMLTGFWRQIIPDNLYPSVYSLPILLEKKITLVECLRRFSFSSEGQSSGRLAGYAIGIAMTTRRILEKDYIMTHAPDKSILSDAHYECKIKPDVLFKNSRKTLLPNWQPLFIMELTTLDGSKSDVEIFNLPQTRKVQQLYRSS